MCGIVGIASNSEITDNLAHLINIPKIGFSLPLSIIMRKIIRSTFDKVMHKNNFLNSKYFSQNFHENIVYSFLKGNNKYIEIVWRVFILQLWLKNGL